MKEAYKSISFNGASLALIDIMDGIVTDYQRQGYVLTVRQLYYQLVARAIVPNTENSYKRITSLVNDAKMAGYIDWSGIEDRTRSFTTRARYDSAKERLELAAKYFHMDMWVRQPARVFVIVEKEALAGVLESTCWDFDVPLLAARGYPSGTVLREFVERDILPVVRGYEQEDGQDIIILHLGDHDPSGLDMTRDLTERIDLFARKEDFERSIAVERIALSMEQIREVNPPPNPAKSTDARFMDYRRKYGSESWELDALTPQYLNRLLKRHIESYIDGEYWDERKAEIDGIKERMIKVAEEFE